MGTPIDANDGDSEHPNKPKRAGRPRKEASKIKILKAANSILEEKGIAGFLAETAPKIPYAPSGTAQEQIVSQLQRVAEVYSGATGKVLAALIAEAQRDPNTMAAFIEEFAQPRREAAKKILAAGIERGELRSDVDIEIILDTLYAPIYYRMLVPLNPLSALTGEQIAQHVFTGLMPMIPGDQ